MTTIGELVGGPADGIRLDPWDSEEPDDWPDCLEIDCPGGVRAAYRIRLQKPTRRGAASSECTCSITTVEVADMPCPICQHTMQNIGAEGQRIFWCPRCGALKTVAGDHESFEAPKLVGLVRDAEAQTIRTSVDGRTIQHAVPGWFWRSICEAVGIPVRSHDC